MLDDEHSLQSESVHPVVARTTEFTADGFPISMDGKVGILDPMNHLRHESSSITMIDEQGAEFVSTVVEASEAKLLLDHDDASKPKSDGRIRVKH